MQWVIYLNVNFLHAFKAFQDVMSDKGKSTLIW
jgi:hypothetical protein